MLTNGQTEARKLRSRLKPSDHRRRRPLGRVRAAHARGVPPHRRGHGGRGAGHGAASASPTRSTCPSPSDVAAGSGRRRSGSCPTKNTLDRATAMLPRLMYERLDDLGLDFAVVYPTAGPRLLSPAAGHEAAPGALPRLQRVHGRSVPADSTTASSRPRSSRCTRRRRRSRSWSSPSKQLGYQGHDGRRAHAPPDPRARRGASRRLEVRRMVRRRSASTATTTTIRCGRSAASFASRRASTTARAPSCSGTRRRTSATTTSATSPPPVEAIGQGALLRRRDPPLPRAELRLPRGRRGLGLLALRRSHRALGEA